MEEDVEIELLLQRHGKTLEAAAAIEIESEYEAMNTAGSSHCDFEGIDSDITKWAEYDSASDDERNSVTSSTSSSTENIESSSDEDVNHPTDKRIRNKNITFSRTRGARSKLRPGNILHKRHQRRRENRDSGDDSDDLQDSLDKQIMDCKVKDVKKSLINPNSGTRKCQIVEELLGNDESLQESGFDELQNNVELEFANRTYDDLICLQKKSKEREVCYFKLIESLRKSLNECQERQRMINETLSNIQASSKKKKEPVVSRCFFKLFGMPYFEDSRGFAPPPNEDTKKKLKNGELIVSTVPKMRYWAKEHKAMLEEAVKDTIIDERSETLVKKIENLNEFLKNVGSKVKQKDVCNKKTDYQQQLNKLKKMSYSELLAGEDPDREYDWLKYSATVFNLAHSSDECRRFWHVYLKPSINKSCWEMEEDLKLLKVANNMHFQDWDAIAQMLGTNRTAYQCFVHYQTRIHERSGLSSGKWTKEEDEKLLAVISASQIGDFIPWTKVASHFSNRSHTQIYNRWMNCLDPSLVKGKFSKDEDLLIVSGIEVFGVTYKEMASLLCNRTANQVRERYERYLQPKNTKVGTWSLEEDKELISLVKKYGDQNWRAVAEEMKTRTRTQARQRYTFIKHMTETKPGWTPEKVKRRSIHTVSKSLKRTEKLVKKVKQEVEKVENTFKLTELESNLFKIEKLKELRNDLSIKTYGSKRKKKETPENSKVYKELISFFQTHDSGKSLQTKYQTGKDYAAYLSQILTLAKYFGHDLKLPESESELTKSKNLNHYQKTFLKVILNQGLLSTESKLNGSETGKEINYSEYLHHESLNRPTPNNLSQDCSADLEYKEPETDDTLLMQEWWHSPPVNVQNWNFSEFFKRIVFDFSYGLHRDIWESKLKRSDALQNYTVEFNEEEKSKSSPQPFFIPPNLETLVGLKTLLIGRTRLRRLANKALAEPHKFDEPSQVKSYLNLKYELLDKFQETMISMFTWPRILSLTNIKSTPLVSAAINKFDSRNVVYNHRKIVTLLNNPDGETSDVTEVICPKPNIASGRRKKIGKLANVKHRILDHKRTLSHLRKGITPERKMKVEHLLENKKNKPENLDLKNTKTLKPKRKVGRPRKIVNSSVAAQKPCQKVEQHKKEESELVCDLLPLKTPKVTYSRTVKRKRPCESNRSCEVADKKLCPSISADKSSSPRTVLVRECPNEAIKLAEKSDVNKLHEVVALSNKDGTQ